MKIVFFGASHGVPEPNRRCSCAMIETGEARYFVDMGTQATEQLMTRGIPMDAVKTIFVSHMHGDHTDGLISFVDLCNGVLSDKPLFFLLNSYTTGLSASTMKYITDTRLLGTRDGYSVADELGLPVKNSGLALPGGSSVRVTFK